MFCFSVLFALNFYNGRQKEAFKRKKTYDNAIWLVEMKMQNRKINIHKMTILCRGIEEALKMHFLECN
jgi:hypothetical protein